jgi:hypothetical protein
MKKQSPGVKPNYWRLTSSLLEIKSVSNLKTVPFLWSAVFIFLFPGCISLYYAPNKQNVPMFTEKNVAEASAAFQMGTLTSGYDVDVAYSITNHFGMLANYNHWSAKEKMMLPQSEVEYYISGKGNLIELGAGYFMPFMEKFVFEVYSGMGLGDVRNDYEINTTSKINYNRYFIQPSCGYYNKRVNLIFSTRLSGVDYKSVNFDDNLEAGDLIDLENIRNNPFALFMEPAFTLRVGGKYLKFQFQASISDNLTTPELIYEPLCITAGLIGILPIKNVKKNIPVETR